MTRRIIVRGDDYGSWPAANRAIVDACRDGVLRNVSVLVPAPWFRDGVAALKACRGVEIGLHIGITCEWESPRWGPVSDPRDVPSLIDDDGNFLHDPVALFRRGVKLDELMREATAQLAVARGAGLDVRYVDEHMGVSWLHEPSGTTRFVEPLRAWVHGEGLAWHGDVLADATTMEAPRPWTTEGLVAQLDRIGEDAPGFLLTHPGYAEGEMATARFRGQGGCGGQVGIERTQDTAVLRDPRFARELRARGIVNATFSDVAAARRGAARATG